MKYSAVMTLIRKYASSVPVDVMGIAERSGITLMSLTEICASTGLSPGDVFSIWGNRDGAANAHNGRCVIAYNDTVPLVRCRFTVAEELMHIFLGHLSPEFNVFDQSYSPGAYRRREEEAKTCAGMLLCPPRLYYTYESYITPQTLSRLCEVSEECASRAMGKYSDPRVRAELLENIDYRFMPVPSGPPGSARRLWNDRDNADET